MYPVIVALGAGLLAATGVWGIVRRWPRADPTAPKGRAIEEGIRRRPGLAAALATRMNPAKATGLALSVAVLVFVATAVSFGVALAIVRDATNVPGIDQEPAQWASAYATDLSTDVLHAITDLGGTAVVVPLAILVGVLEYRRLPARALPLFLAIVVIGQNLIVNLTKFMVDRVRPDIDPLATFSGPSFPSGHSAAAAACYAAFALLIGRRRDLSVKALVAGSAAGVAAMVAASRVLLGVHWFTDVVAGLAMGWMWFALCSVAFGGRLLRFGAPVEAGERSAPEPAEPAETVRRAAAS